MSSQPSDDSRVALKFTGGDVIFHEGSYSDDFYLIKSGRICIYKTSKLDGLRTNLATLGAGSLIGEMAAATGRVRSASAQCIDHCTLIKFSGAELRQKFRQTDPMVREIIETLISNIHSANALVVGKRSMEDKIFS